MSSGSTYKDSFTIRYDNATDTDRETVLFELGTDNPNRAIPFPVGAFLGIDTAPTTFQAIGTDLSHVQYIPTTNQVFTVAKEQGGGTPVLLQFYNIDTGTYTPSIYPTVYNIEGFVRTQPCVIPSLSYIDRDGNEKLYEGVAMGFESQAYVGGYAILLISPNAYDPYNYSPNVQILNDTVDLSAGAVLPPLLYNIDLDELFSIGLITNISPQRNGICVLSKIREESIIIANPIDGGSTGNPPIRNLVVYNVFPPTAGFPIGMTFSQFKLFVVQPVNIAEGIVGIYDIILTFNQPAFDGATNSWIIGYFQLRRGITLFGVNTLKFAQIQVQSSSIYSFIEPTLFTDIIMDASGEQYFLSQGGVDNTTFNTPHAEIIIISTDVSPINTSITQGFIQIVGRPMGSLESDGTTTVFQMEYDSPRNRIICLGLGGGNLEDESYMILHNIPTLISLDSTSPLLNPIPRYFREDVILFFSPVIIPPTIPNTFVGMTIFDTSSDNRVVFSDDDSVLFLRCRKQDGVTFAFTFFLITINLVTENFEYNFTASDGTSSFKENQVDYRTNDGFDNFTLTNNGSLIYASTDLFSGTPRLYFNSASGSATANGVIIGETSNQTYAEVENSQTGSIMDVQSVRINIIGSATEVEKQNQILEPLVFGHRDINGNDVEYAKVPTIDPFQAQFTIPEIDLGSEGTKYMLDGNTRLKYEVKKQTTVDVTFNYSKVKNLLQDTRKGLNELTKRQEELSKYDKNITENLDTEEVTVKKQSKNISPNKRRKRRYKMQLSKQLNKFLPAKESFKD